MILVTGGNSQGKLVFVRAEFGFGDEDITDGGACAFEDAFSKPVLDGLYRLIARMLDAAEDLEALVERGLMQNPEIIVVCDEAGCGIVPVDPRERELRERVGRLQCLLASRASRVYRVCCGIPELIKGA
ncbi:MAG: bifunctional adenosylcobinamide kinase/adenosylcobinamide-phosphate guanylyltransferase [Clostridia bacterium]|nr:bifunctional adenosylcobinamide kinase/adenosylcobinamide-phosphate guanylyltransferase [Clostridia bacterium]MDR3645231.1 bifunctional adenosylcobinamide kinase/adenosylcobinamide-phosphate guanylyltransferase [Clostridia bacterium]